MSKAEISADRYDKLGGDRSADFDVKVVEEKEATRGDERLEDLDLEAEEWLHPLNPALWSGEHDDLEMIDYAEAVLNARQKKEEESEAEVDGGTAVENR